MKCTVYYDVVNLILRMCEEASKMEIDRINSVFLLKSLLENEESPLADAIFNQIECDYYQDILCLCYERLTIMSCRKRKRDLPYETIEFKLEDRLVSMKIDEDLFDLVRNLSMTEYLIDINELTRNFVNVMPTEIVIILRSVGINIKALKEVFQEDQYNQKNKEESEIEAKYVAFNIPNEIKSFVQNLNEKFRSKKCDISGRDKECELVWQTLQKRTKRNVILIGEPGVGKTSIVEKITYDIVSGNCPEEFKNMTVLSLDVTSSIAGTIYRGQAEERYAILSEFLEGRSDVILFIDEIHLIRGAGATREGEADLANAIKPILAGSNVRVIGATTVREYNEYFSKDGAIKRRFRPIEVKEPKIDEVYPMLEKSIETLSKYHHVKIDKPMIDYIILNSSCFNYETKNPDRTKDLIDLSMVVAKQNGKAKVDEECVRSNFKYNLEYFEKMSRDDKLSVAYHEAGHAIVSKCSGLLKNHKVIAISILPTEEYNGVTVYDFDDSYVNPTFEYFIDEIASNLAGRVAEKMYTKTLSSGAATDLKHATEYAYNVVTKYGMSELGVNRSYDTNIMNEKISTNVNEAIDKIINKATERAETILNSNIDALHKLVEMLLQKGIVSEKEFSKLFEKKSKKVTS